MLPEQFVNRRHARHSNVLFESQEYDARMKAPAPKDEVTDVLVIRDQDTAFVCRAFENFLVLGRWHAFDHCQYVVPALLR